MRALGLLFSCWFLVFALVSAQPPCRFASLYTQYQLLTNTSARNEYLERVMYWEGQFHKDGVGMSLASGLTYDGHPIDYVTGEISGDPHLFSAASKESIHVSILAHILNGNNLAQLLISNDSATARETAITILENKINSYESFNAEYPGFGGYLPWYAVNDTGMFLLDGWTDQVPSLDNGELIWGLTALVEILNQQGLTDLAQRYQNQLNLMAQYGSMIFYAGNGNVRCVTKINNISATPTPSNYGDSSDNCYLDDPYEGELFVFFLGTFGNLSQADQDLIWQNKLKKLQAVNYKTPTGDITVERGYVYSTHEKWKFLMLPYQDVEIMQRVFKNGEKARTWDAFLHGLPGMFAAVNDVTQPNNLTIPDYDGDTGIPEIAFQPVTRRDVITGYSTYALFLTDQVTALLWYDNYLKGPKGQTPYGAVEGIAINGTMISPLTTWDTKMTTVAAMLGGVVDFNRKALNDAGYYDAFIARVNQTWSQVFTDLKGEDLPFMVPTKNIPHGLADFTSCAGRDEVVISI